MGEWENGRVHEWLCATCRRRELLIIYIAILIVTGLAMFAMFTAADAAHDQAEIANARARVALLQREQVCSLSNQGLPCRDLFRRLASSITDAQRRELACTVITFLDGKEADRIARVSHCVR